MASAAVIYYLLLYGRFSSYQADCNLVIMGSAIFPVFIYYFEKQKPLPTFLSFVFLISNREDFALGLFFICLLLAIIHFKDKKKRLVACIFCLFSVILFIGVFGFIIPALEDENKKFSLFNYEALGNSPYEAFLFVLSHPIDTIKLFFVNHTHEPEKDFVKLTFYMVYFISGGFVLFFRPVYFIAFIPLIAKKMFNDESFRWGHEGYNGVEVSSLLPIFVFSILGDFKSKNLSGALSAGILLFTSAVTIYYMTHMSPLYYGFNKFNVFSGNLYSSDYDYKKLNTMLEKIPSEAAVSASGRVLPHLAFREKIYHFPKIKDADYICVYKAGSTFPISEEEFNRKCDSLKVNKDWKVLFEEEQCLLLQKK